MSKSCATPTATPTREVSSMWNRVISCCRPHKQRSPATLESELPANGEGENQRPSYTQAR